MLYFTSDQHYHHLRALELMPGRPWSTLQAMNEGLILRHNSVVSQDDVVIMLGDFVMGPKAQNIPAILPRLLGRKYLILGNHDAGFNPQEHRAEEKLRLYTDHGINQLFHGCVSLNDLLRQIGEEDYITPEEILLCHFPYKGTPDHGYEVRYEAQMPVPTDKLLLHGHTHRSEVKTSPKMIHVGVDAWNWTPVSLNQILDLYRTF